MRIPVLTYACSQYDRDRIDLAVSSQEGPEAIPIGIREFLRAARADDCPVTVVSGLPLGPLPPTPLGWQAAESGTWVERLLLLCASAMGDPFGWSGQQGGRLVHDICPSPGQEVSLTSQSSTQALALHTEDVFHPCRADYVALLCVRNPDRISTTVSTVTPADVPEVAPVLWADRFRFIADDSHVCCQGVRDSNTGAVFFGPVERPYLRFDVDFMEGLDPEAQAAMDVANQRLQATVEEVVLSPGDLVFLDNYRVVHGRSPFRARYDGEDRWLKRVNLIRDIRRIYTHTKQVSSIISTHMVANGETD